MDKLILLLVGIVIGVAVVLLLGKQAVQPGKRPVQPKPDVLVEGAEVETGGLFAVPEDVVRMAGTVMPHPSTEYPNTVLNLRLHDLPREINVAAQALLPRPIVAYCDTSLAHALLLEEPSSTLFQGILPRLFISHANAAMVFILEQPLQELVSSTALVEPRPLVEYADAGYTISLGPPLELLKGGEQ